MQSVEILLNGVVMFLCGFSFSSNTNTPVSAVAQCIAKIPLSFPVMPFHHLPARSQYYVISLQFAVTRHLV